MVAPVGSSNSYSITRSSALTVSDPNLGILGYDTDAEGDDLTVCRSIPRHGDRSRSMRTAHSSMRRSVRPGPLQTTSTPTPMTGPRVRR